MRMGFGQHEDQQEWEVVGELMLNGMPYEDGLLCKVCNGVVDSGRWSALPCWRGMDAALIAIRCECGTALLYQEVRRVGA